LSTFTNQRLPTALAFLKAGFHRLADTGGIHSGPYADSWNGVWELFKNSHPAATIAEILQQLEKMIGDFNL